MNSVFAKAWRDRRRGLIGWIIGIGVLSALAIAFWPTIVNNKEFQEAMDSIPESLKFLIGQEELTSPSGYLNARLFAFMVPILLLIYSIGQGSDSIAGEEQRHTMDLLLAHPVTRRSVVLQKYGATCIGLVILTVVLIVGVGIGIPLVDMNIPFANIVAASVGCFLLAMHFGALALWVGAATGKKAIATGVAAGWATASFFIDSLAPQVDVLEPVRKVSSFYYYSGTLPLRNGFAWSHFAVLAVTAALFLAAAIWFFDRKDVSV